MKNIDAKVIEDTVARLCIEANLRLPPDVINAIESAEKAEPWDGAKRILSLLGDNVRIASEKTLPVCQDTGMACVFVELGQDVHIDGDFEEAVNNGVRRGYGEGYLRKSVVCDPLRRVNTGDNTPALLTVKLTRGDKMRITVMPKGFGSENMSALKMLKPADGVEGVKNFVLETVEKAGANPCPPIIVGVGIGGSFDKAAYLAKHALLRPDVYKRQEFAFRAPSQQSFKKPVAPPSAPKPKAAEKPQFSVGDRVRHKAFGDGKLSKMTPMGNDYLIEIEFDSGTVKKLMLRAAALHMVKI